MPYYPTRNSILTPKVYGKVWEPQSGDLNLKPKPLTARLSLRFGVEGLKLCGSGFRDGENRFCRAHAAVS